MANSSSTSCTARPPGDRGVQCGRPPGRSTGIVLFVFVLASTLAAGPGFAREGAAARTVKESMTAPGYSGAPDKRGVELRRALISGPDAPRPAAQEPRRLSREQRETLYQELREAMRDANRPRSMTAR